MARRFSIAAFFFVLSIWLSPVSVEAHASLVQADPGPDTTRDAAPEILTLRFDQPLQAGYSTVTVYDADRHPVKVAADPIDPNDPFALAVGMPKTPTGAYTVVWQALGADGFVIRGAFGYTVALPGDPPPALVAGVPEITGDAANRPSFLAVLLRGLRDAGIAALVGGIGVFLICVSPALVVLPRETRRSLRRTLDGWLRRWLLGALGVALGAHLLALVVQVATANNATLGDAMRAGPVLAFVQETTPGAVWRLQTILLLALGEWIVLLPLLHRRSVPRGRLGIVAQPTPTRAAMQGQEAATAAPLWGWVIALIVGLALLLVTAFGGHAIAVQDRPVLALAAGWGHLIAASLWFGGLILIAGPVPAALHDLTGQERGQATAAIIGRFSTLALASIAALAVTGAYAITAYTTRETLGTTAYGLITVAKVALVAIVLAIIGLNRRALHRRSARAMLRRGMNAAVVLGIALIGLTGLLTQLPPARTSSTTITAVAMPPVPAGAVVVQPVIVVDGVRALLTVETSGADTTFAASITDDTGAPRADVRGVTLWLNSGDRDIGQITVPMQPAGEGTYRATGQWLAIGQNWLARLVVRRQDVAADVILPFVLQPRPMVYPDEEPVPPARFLQPRLLPTARVGVVLLALGVALLAVALAVRLRRATWRRASVVGAVGVALAGLIVAGWYSVPTTPLTGHANPQPATAAVIAQGQALYAQTCATCHGASGTGTGTPGAPLPAAIAARYTDGDLYWLITNGVPGTGMPPLRARLSPAERWQIVRYLRAVQSGTGIVADR